MGPDGTHGGQVAFFNIHNAFVDHSKSSLNNRHRRALQLPAVHNDEALLGSSSGSADVDDAGGGGRVRRRPADAEDASKGSSSGIRESCAFLLHVANMWTGRFPLNDFKPPQPRLEWEGVMPVVAGGAEGYVRNCLPLASQESRTT